MKKVNIQSPDLYTDITLEDNPLFKRNVQDCDIIIVSTLYHKYIVSSMMHSFIIAINKKFPEIQIGLIESPGSFELPITIQIIAEKYRPKLFLALGCIIKGETNHDQYLSSAVTEGLINLSLKYNIPILNGVLTTNTMEQAIDRAGKSLDKGKDLAKAAVKMLSIQDQLKYE